MKTGADYLADELYAHGVRTVFVFTGGAIAAIIDYAQKRGIKVIPRFCAESIIAAIAPPVKTNTVLTPCA